MKITIKTITILALFITFGMQAQRQHKPIKNQEVQQKVMKRKLLFLKENLMLNKQEAKDFEVAYSTYMKEKMALNKKLKEEVIKKVKNNNVSELTENERKKIIENKLKFDQQRCELERNFTLKLTKILPSEKTIRYFKLDRQFNKLLIKRLKDHQRKRQAMKKRRKMMKKRQEMMKERQKELENKEQ